MAKTIEIVGGNRAAGFPWGTVPRLTARTFELDETQIGMVMYAMSTGTIASWRSLETAPSTVEAASTPVVAPKVAERPSVSAEQRTLADIYEASFNKKLVGEITRDELVKMYETVTAKKAGKKRDATLIKELCDAFRS